MNLGREARRVSGCENLVIAGGVGLNGLANWRIEREGIFDNVWIQPAAGDDGGAVGAALWIATQVFKDERCPPMTHAGWGPEWSDREIVDFLSSRAIPFAHLDEEKLVERTAELIAEGKVGGWMQGRMEYGARALGARSLLAEVESSTAMEGNLGSTTVAEGIEMEVTIGALQSIDCTWGQGYYFAQPMTPVDAEAYLLGIQKERCGA